MSRKWYLVLGLLLCLPIAWWVMQHQNTEVVNVTPTEGISHELAAARKRTISALAYD